MLAPREAGSSDAVGGIHAQLGAQLAIYNPRVSIQNNSERYPTSNVKQAYSTHAPTQTREY